jgi:hypothetical protein
MGLGRKSTELVHQRMAARRPFRRGNVWATVEPAGSRGWLTVEAWDVYQDDAPTYTVMSYGTPIAWLVTTGREGLAPFWRIPGLRHSQSTTNHQRTAMVGADLAGEEVRDLPSVMLLHLP